MNPRLSFPDRMRLVEALLAVDGMRDHQKRAMYLDELNRELGATVFFSRDTDVRHDIHGIVTDCLDHPGAIQTLVAIVGSFHPGTAAVQRLEQLVRQVVTDPLLDPVARRRLDRILSTVGGDDMAVAYRQSIGPFGPTIDVDVADRLAVVAALEEIAATPGRPPPLLLFLEHLAARLGPAPATALRQWIDVLLARMAVPDGELRRVREAAAVGAAPAARRSYLTIQVEPDALAPRQYILSAWMQDDEGYGETLRVDEPPMPLPQLPQEVDRLLREVSRNSQWDLDELFVEVVLPRALLHHRVDRWLTRIGPSDLAYRIGLEWPVVIRCLERMGNRAVRGRWQRKWRWLTANGRHPLAEAVHWVREPGRIRPEALISDLLLDEQDIPVCLVVATTPRGGTGQTPEIDAALHAGIPVIVWCLEDRPIDHLEADVTHLLRHGVLGLPGTVLRLRRDAVRLGEPAGHLGLHLALLWDDADRVPEPYQPLKAPA